MQFFKHLAILMLLVFALESLNTVESMLKALLVLCATGAYGIFMLSKRIEELHQKQISMFEHTNELIRPSIDIDDL